MITNVAQGISTNAGIIILGVLFIAVFLKFLLITHEYFTNKKKYETMEIHTKDKEMSDHLKKGLKEINKKDNKEWSEYELRLLIQDELSCISNEIVDKPSKPKRAKTSSRKIKR